MNEPRQEPVQALGHQLVDERMADTDGRLHTREVQVGGLTTSLRAAEGLSERVSAQG